MVFADVSCGDGSCDGGEDSYNCPNDCGSPHVCGDGSCDPGENCLADNSACPSGQSCTNGCVGAPTYCDSACPTGCINRDYGRKNSNPSNPCLRSCGSAAGPQAYCEPNWYTYSFCDYRFGAGNYNIYPAYDCDTQCCGPKSSTLPKITVTKSGTGSGTVTSNPTGIDCGSTCSFDFNSGASVTLTATPAQGSTFSDWGGDCTGTTCTLTMSAAKTVTATFNGQGTGCGERGWRDPSFWGGCGDCSGCGSAGCGEALAYCDGTNWNNNWDPLVTEGQRSTATSGHVCPCRSSQGLCSPINPPITFGPYDVNNLDTEKKRTWRILICYQAATSSLDSVISAYQTAYGVALTKSSPTTRDKLVFPSSGIVDLIIDADGANPTWAWQPVSGTTLPPGCPPNCPSPPPPPPNPDADKWLCERLGFRWTGSKCCGEPEDRPEYYNDAATGSGSGPIGGVIAGTTITGYSTHDTAGSIPPSGGRIFVSMDLPDELNAFYFRYGSNCEIYTVEEDTFRDDKCGANANSGTIIKGNGRLSDGIAAYWGSCDDDAKVVMRKGFGDSVDTSACSSCGLNRYSGTYGPKGDLLCGYDGIWYLCDLTFHGGQDKPFTSRGQTFTCKPDNTWVAGGVTTTSGNFRGTDQVSVAVGEVKDINITGGTPPYTIDTPCDGVFAACTPMQQSGRWILRLEGRRATTQVTWTIIKDSSSPFRTKGYDVTVTQAGTGLTANPNSITINAGSTSSPITISGGTGPYKIRTNSDSSKATTNPIIRQTFPSTFTVTGVAQGSVTIIVEDSAATPNTASITITISPARTNFPCDPPGVSPRISFGPYDVNNLDTEKKKTWRILICYQAATSSLDSVISAYQTAYGVALTKSSPTTRDKLVFPSSGTVDLIIDADGANPTWAWQPESGATPPPPPNPGDGGLGGCWNSKAVMSISYVEGTKNSVINIKGQFYGCAIDKQNYNRDNDNFLSIMDSHTRGQLIKNENYCINIADYFCSYTEKWEPTNGMVRTTLSIVPVQNVAQKAECCAPNQCWNGETCIADQSGDPLVRPIGDGFRCIDGIWTRQNQICDPDGSICGYCPETKCLGVANNKPQCMETEQYVDDDYCDNGQWSTRTKLLALTLLKIKSGDYSLFCDNRNNALNYIQYSTDSGQLASNILSSLDTNNFCVLKANNKVIVATSTNKGYEEVPSSLNIFGVTSCSNAKNDGNYYSCDSSNKVWYNKKLKSFIYSQTPFSVPAAAEPSSTLINMITKIIDSIKRLITNPPFDQSYVSGIKKFRKLYLAQQGSKSIAAALEGKNLKNAVIEYNNFDTNMCSYIDSYSASKNFTLSGISCKKESNNYYVLAQGSQFTNLDPDTIWTDLTSKLRLK